MGMPEVEVENERSEEDEKVGAEEKYSCPILMMRIMRCRMSKHYCAPQGWEDMLSRRRFGSSYLWIKYKVLNGLMVHLTMLELDGNLKTAIQALLQTQDGCAQEFDDIMPGKGKGLVFLLHGPPGLGKNAICYCKCVRNTDH
jgi:hypothetical protein